MYFTYIILWGIMGMKMGLRLVGKFVFQFDEIAKEVYVIEDEALWRV
jgi:hypothetical protein